MSEGKQIIQSPNLEIFDNGNQHGKSTKNKPQQESNKCKICYASLIKSKQSFGNPNETLNQGHISLNSIIFCHICKNNFCCYNKFSNHEKKCKEEQREIEQSKDYISTTINEDWSSKIKTEDTKNIVKEVCKDSNTDFELPFTMQKIQENNILQQSRNNANTQIEAKGKNYLVPKQVLSTFKMTLERQKNTFQEAKISKGAEMDTIEIIGQSTICSNNLGLKPDNRQSSVKIHTSKNTQEEISTKHVPVVIPINKIVNSISKKQKSSTKTALPIITTKNDQNIKTPWINFVKILPKSVNESTIPKHQIPTTLSTGQDICLGKGIPLQNFLVKSQDCFKKVRNQTLVGQTIIRPASYVLQTATKELHKPAQYNVIIDSKLSPVIVQNVVKHTRVPDKNIRSTNKQINTEHNLQAMLRRKKLLPGPNVGKKTLPSTPIMNLPINIRNIQVPSASGAETQKCVIMKSILKEIPASVLSTFVKEQDNVPNSTRNPTNSPRGSSQVHSESKVLMKSIHSNILERPVNVANFNLTKNPIQNVDKSGCNILHTFNAPNTSNTVENGSYPRITAGSTFIPTLHALSEVQDNLKEKDTNTTDNRNELKEMLMDEHELDQLLLLAEKMKQTSPMTGLENDLNLVQSVAKTNVARQNQILNEDTIKIEIKTESLDAGLYNNLRLMQETEAAITESKGNNDCPEKDKAIAVSILPSDVNSVKPKVENVDCVELKPENLDANENQELSRQNLISLENIVRLTKEKSSERVVAPISSNIAITTDPKENNENDSKILLAPEDNKTTDTQNLITKNISVSQNVQRNTNDNFMEEKGISQTSNIHNKSTAKQELINLINDSDNDNYEVETLDEGLLECEDFLRNGEKTENDQEVIEIFDDSELSDVDPEIRDTVQDAIKCSGLKKTFYCPKCKLPFCSYTSISRHIISDHKQRFCYCKICNPIKETSNKISLISILQHKKNSMKNQTQNYIFYCELCQERFNNVISFNRHKTYCTISVEHAKNRCSKQYFNTRKHPRKQLFYCEVCQERFNNFISFNRHKVDCTMKVQHTKNRCKKQYFNTKKYPRIQSSDLKDDDGKNVIKSVCTSVDSARKLDDEPFGKKHQCTFCGNIYATLQTRLRHEAGYCRKNEDVPKAMNLYPCEKCNKQFTSTITRSFHMKMYCYDKNQEMKFECTKCDKKFPFGHMLQHHFALRHVHAYYCDYCQRSFSDKHHLTRHIIGHMGMKPFKCNICSQKFSRKCKLQLHLQRHTNKKDYDCKICNKKFMFANLLKKHMNFNCSEENIKACPFLCDVCKKRYKDKKHIEKHMLNMHVKKFPCNICDKVFGQKFKLNMHLVTHGRKYCCNVCKKNFLTKSRFIRHKASHCDYLCECGQKFNLRYDYYKHRTYWCAKTTGKPIDEIVKSDAILSKIKNKSTQAESVKAKRKHGSIKKIRKLQEGEVDSDKNNKIEDGKKHVCDDDTNNAGLDNTDRKDNCCLQKFVTAKLENNSSDMEINRDIKKILRKRKNYDNSSQDISNTAAITNDHYEVNKNNSLKQFLSPVLLTNTNKTRNKTKNIQTIATRNKVYFKRKGQIKKNAKVVSKAVNKNVAMKNKDIKGIANSKNKKMKRDNTALTNLNSISLRKGIESSYQDFKVMEVNPLVSSPDTSIKEKNCTERNETKDTQEENYKSNFEMNRQMHILENQNIKLNLNISRARNVEKGVQTIHSFAETIEKYMENRYRELKCREKSTQTDLPHKIDRDCHYDADHMDYDIIVKQEPVEKDIELNIKEEIDRKTKKREQKDSDSEKESKKFKCDICKIGFKCKRPLVKHFNGKSHILEHKKVHNSLFNCDICRNDYSLKCQISRHLCAAIGKCYNCPWCDFQFYAQRQLLEHQKVHSKDKVLMCKSCNIRFDEESLLIEHQQKHLICEICQRQFHKKSHLVRHMYMHSTNKPFCCDNCDKKFATYSILKRHMLCHSDMKPFSCEICNKSFTRKSTCDSHKETHNTTVKIASKPYLCLYCDRRFGKKSDLERHKFTHSTEKPCACHICGRQFTSHSYLKRHILNHSDVKPFPCDLCDKQFVSSTILKRHLLSHSSDKPYACEICHKNFKRKWNYMSHKLIHNEVKPYLCDVCNSQFTQRHHLITHLRIHTGDKPFACDICNKRFGQKGSVLKHKRIHTGVKPYSCTICGKSFTEKSTLTHHHLTHSGEKRFACDVCPKQFGLKTSLIIHRRTHTGEKPFSCDVCNRPFAERSSLRKHKMNLHKC